MAVDQLIERGDAAALIPEEVAREIIKGMPAASAALSLMRRTTMARGQQRQPVLAALPQAYWVGGDTGLKQTTKAAWANKYLNAEEMAVIVPIPEAVLDDSDYPIWDETRPYLIEAAGALVDAATLFGVGKPDSWPAAIVPAAAAAGNEFIRGSVGGQDVSVDIGGEGGVMQLVEADGFEVNAFAADTTFKASLRGLRDDQGQPIFQPSLTQDTPPTLYGEPMAYVNNGEFDTDEALLVAGDWRNAIIGVRRDFSFSVHTEGVISDDAGNVILNLMQQDSAALRLVARFGFQVANPISRRAQVEAERFPFAVLRPAGYEGS